MLLVTVTPNYCRVGEWSLWSHMAVHTSCLVADGAFHHIRLCLRWPCFLVDAIAIVIIWSLLHILGRGINAKEVLIYWIWKGYWLGGADHETIVDLVVLALTLVAEANLIMARNETIAASSENWINMWVETGYLSAISFQVAAQSSFSSIWKVHPSRPPLRASPLYSYLRSQEMQHNPSLLESWAAGQHSGGSRLIQSPTAILTVEIGNSLT